VKVLYRESRKKKSSECFGDDDEGGVFKGNEKKIDLKG